jgi:putative flavoprotein involved in K+ transport
MRTTTVIIGAGHAGLAASRCLAQRGVDHVVLERGEVANTWKTERWDSLRLLTPNWQSRLPGYGYQGDSPDGFRTIPETIGFIERYAQVIDAPVQTHTTVKSVRRVDEEYVVETDRGTWRCRTVILATGAFQIPNKPKVAGHIPTGIHALTPNRYRNPDQLEEGGVLVVGASSTGVQIADELQRSGRQVVLAVGDHVRVPRLYRGRDIQWWMDTIGAMDERYDEMENLNRARSLPSLQLVGSDDQRTLDLNALTAHGVQLVGRLAGVSDGKAQFSGSLNNYCASADLKMDRLLDRIDEWVEERGFDGLVDPPRRFEPTRTQATPRLGLDLTSGEIKTVLWATGFRPDWSWLDVPVFDRKGRIRHDGGIVDAPGLYLMGLPFLRRRKSSFIDGAGDDARDLTNHLVAYLAGNGASDRVLVGA